MAEATKRTKRRASHRAASRSGARPTSAPVGPEPEWYKDAIIYELHVRAFADSNADGIGDFKGLTEKLPYLQDLGVTAVWLLPFYPSPLRDDGYDIADYTGVNPMYGNRRDVRRFIDEAHKLGIKVITELVINHTSDQHPWFQRARKAPRGSRYRDFYVWSDDPDKYAETRIIFKDFEASNWSYDPVAGQYYWHRFYHHQPDLNFDNPEVHDAVLKALDHWFEAGVDGMRLDAIPYLYEREGTNCENLPETHDFLRKLRAHVDSRWPGRMLLAEANQWPEDSREYFGDGDECHMSFHFPLMPRLFMALRMEDQFPVIDILQQTPEIPDSCQWAIFLRNHDELTLEMVTDEERDYMYRSYAFDQRMRINLGIRRRLAPLLSNNRRKIELMNGLLFSLPGTPVLYYGDEIGMGDNVYLGDRDSVRTPMQWSADRNAGFSRANPQKLYLPIIIDPEYHYETVNVESQLSNASSLLWWMKRLIALRKRHPVFGRGSIEFLHPDNAKVLAFVRQDGDEHILVVANLSRFTQPVELDLSLYKGQRPVEMFGHTAFPEIGDLPYFLTLGPHAFHWFQLKSPHAEGAGVREPPVTETRADLNRWLLSGAASRWLERELPDTLPLRRWFASKSRSIRAVSIDEAVPLPLDSDPSRLTAALFLARVEYAGADDEVYALPMALAEPGRAALLFGEQSPAILGTITSGDQRRVLYDGAADDEVWSALLRLVRSRKSARGAGGDLHSVRVKRAPRIDEGLEVHLSRFEQSNSSAIFSDRFIMKLFRRIEEGTNPDFEISRFLTEKARFKHTPRVAGALEYRPRRGGEPITVAMTQELVANQGDAWNHTLDAIGRFFERVLTLPPEDAEPPAVSGDALGLSRASPDFAGREMFDQYIEEAEQLGLRTAELHLALASDPEDPAFAPEEFTRLYQRSLYQSMRNSVQRSLQPLRAGIKRLESPDRERAQMVLDRREELIARLRRVSEQRIESIRIRCHGDYHLGQVLWTGKDFVIIDFEGEPMRPIGERRLKRSALMDVAGMLRSIQYAAHTGLHELVEQGTIAPEGEQHELFARWAGYWRRRIEASFLRGYLARAAPPLVPEDDDALRILLDAWQIQKAAYELAYEFNNRPTWVPIPVQGIIELIEPPAT